MKSNLAQETKAKWRSLGTSLLRRCVRLFLIVYATVLVALMAMETSLVYPGAPHGDFDQTHIAHEDVWIDSTDGVRIHAWFLEAKLPGQSRRALLMNHGNAENISHMLEEADRYRKVHGLDVLIYDYRGFGKSTGTPYEAGVLSDAEAAWSWLSKRTGLGPDKIFVFGRSLGGGVAVHVAARFNAAGLILDRTFSSVVDVAAARYWFIPVRWIIRNRYMSTEKILDYAGPLLQLHGDQDEVINLTFAKELYAIAPSQNKTFVESPGTTHLDNWPADFTVATDKFLGSLR